MAGKKTRTLKKKGRKPIKFHVGGLHESLGIASGMPIPKGLFQEALEGKHGAKAAAQARLKKNVLTGPK